MPKDLVRVSPSFILVGLVALVVAAGCVPSAFRQSQEGLDLCLGDRRQPLDPAPIVAAWRRIVRREPVEPLHVRTYSAGRCVSSWWTAVEPSGCAEREPRHRMFALGRGVGTIVYDLGNQRTSLSEGEVSVVDDHLVESTPAATTIATARGPARVPGLPTHVIGDGLAMVYVGEELELLDLADGSRVFAIQPRPPLSGRHSIRAPQVLRDPASPNGIAAIGAMDYVDGCESESFAIDGRGKLLASIRGPAKTVASPVVTGDGIVLVGYGADMIEVRDVRGGTTRARRVPFSGGRTEGVAPTIAAAAGDTIVVALVSRVAVIRGAGTPFGIDAPANDEWVAPRLLRGGDVAVLRTQRGLAVVFDTRTNTELGRVEDAPRFTPDLDAVILIDPRAADDGHRGVVVTAAGLVRRGPIGTTRVGRFSVRTVAGVPDPERACDARALSQIPPLLQYGDLYLPAALVAD